MSKELAVGLRIGADARSALAGISSVKLGIVSLGEVAGQLKTKHNELGAAIQRNLGTLAPRTLAALNRDYQSLGSTIDQLNKKQATLISLQARSDALRMGRADLRGQALETLGLGATVGLPVKLAIDFESAMADVKKVVDFDEPDGFIKLGETIKQMSRTLPLTAGELAAIAASGGQLGVKVKDLPLFTETIAKMSTAFDMGAADAGDSMAKLANVYNIPIKQIGKLGDAINQLSNESPAKARDIVSTLGRVGGVAKQFGLTEIQAASLANAFIALGKPPEVAATAINGMLVKLQTADKQSAKFQKALASMGLEATNLKDTIEKDAQGALLGFMVELNKLPKRDQMGALVDLFGLEYADDVAVLAGSMQTYADSIHTVQKRTKDGKLGFEGSMEREFSERAATTANNLKLLKNSVAELGINIGATVLPALNDLVNTIKPVVWGFTSWAKAHPGLISGTLKLVSGIAALRLASIGARYGFNLMASGVNASLMGFNLLHARGLMLKTMFTTGFRMQTLLQAMGMGADGAATLTARLATLGGVLGKLRVLALSFGRAMLMTPIGLAIGAAALLVYKFWGPIKGFFVGLWEGFSAGLAPIGAAFRAAFAPILPLLRPVVSVLGKLWDWFSDLMTPIEDTGGAAQAFGRKVGEAIGFVVRTFIGLPLKLASLPLEFARIGSDIITGLVNGITNKLSAARDTILSLGTSIKGWFTSTLGIKSPSRVFMGFGDNIAQGTAIGILRGEPQAAQAAGQMAQSTVSAAQRGQGVGGNGQPSTRIFNGPAVIRPDGREFMGFSDTQPQGADIGINRHLPAKPRSALTMTQTPPALTPKGTGGRAGTDPASGGHTITVHLQQTFQLASSDGGIKSQVQEAGRMTERELERMLQRLILKQARMAN